MSYENACPNHERIQAINKLYDEGHTIWYWTARGSGTGKDWRDLTIKQLYEWGAKYHELHMGKLPFDAFIDDKAFNTDRIADALRYICNETKRNVSSD